MTHTASAYTLAPAAHGWSGSAVALPPLGNLDAYISAVNRLPLLTADEERDYAERLQKHNDLEAAGKLVMSHLRLVVSVSRQYLGYGLPHADLIQEGNVGLMKAVKRFDPGQGVRLVSYAMHWIKAEIHEYILKNWRMVKVATTKAQRKLFFNLRSMKQGFKADAVDADTHRDRLSEHEIDVVARELNVKREDVLEMETRLSGGDVVLDPARATTVKKLTARSPTWPMPGTSRPPCWKPPSATAWRPKAWPRHWRSSTTARAASWPNVGSRSTTTDRVARPCTNWRPSTVSAPSASARSKWRP